ncbi:RNA polymerase sigma-70 ECF-like, Rhodopirellula baltica [Planctomycetales bacterium 10988]|nr:RNA polymerase sigma-70 ECF-like, Rhodopirellula baltica [Planctomycetales bacterium 10988]
MLSEKDQELFTALWTEVQPEVSRYIASLVGDSSAVRDILQSTSLALLRKFSQYDPALPFLPWALGVAKFELLAFRRDTARNRICFNTSLLDQYTQTWAEVAPRLSEEKDALRLCVKQLPPKERDLMRLRYFEELNSQEIAKRLRIKATNVRVRLQRIRERLRNCVQQRLKLEGGSL